MTKKTRMTLIGFLFALAVMVFVGGGVQSVSAKTTEGKDVSSVKTSAKKKSKKKASRKKTAVDLEGAKAIALKDADLVEESVTFIKEGKDYDDGVEVYDIEFRSSTHEYEYEIDILTGSILEKSVEKYKKKVKKSTKATDTETKYIGVDKAKDIALDHAGLSEDEVFYKKAKLTKDDGRYVYDVEFYSGEYEYEYEIDAVSGKIREHDKERD